MHNDTSILHEYFVNYDVFCFIKKHRHYFSMAILPILNRCLFLNSLFAFVVTAFVANPMVAYRCTAIRTDNNLCCCGFVVCSSLS